MRPRSHICHTLWPIWSLYNHLQSLTTQYDNCYICVTYLSLNIYCVYYVCFHLFQIHSRSTVETIDMDSHKFYQFQRFEGVEEFSKKSIIPPPLSILEYMFLLLKLLYNLLNGYRTESSDNFRMFHHFKSFKAFSQPFRSLDSLLFIICLSNKTL